MERRQIAVEEMKTLQSIVLHHEGLAFRVKGWYATAIGALIFATYHEHIGLTLSHFYLIWGMLTFAFAGWLLFHRDVVARAIRRSKTVEEALRETPAAKYYIGPKIAQSLSYKGSPFLRRIGARAKLLLVDEQVVFPLIFAGLLIPLFPIFLPLVAPSAGGDPPPVPTTPLIDGFKPRSAGPELSLPDPNVLLTTPNFAVIIGLILMAFGFCLFILKQSRTAKAAAVALILAGAGLHLVGVQNLKIEKLLVFEGPKLEAKISAEIKKILAENPPARPISIRGTLIDHINLSPPREPVPAVEIKPGPVRGARWLGAVTDFEIGRYSVTELPAKWQTEIERICETARAISGTDALLMIVGGTDRLPLAGNTRVRYDANIGLGLARAAAVRDAVIGKGCWPKSTDGENVLILPSGPRTTPEGKFEKRGYPEDRRVDVYVLGAPVAGPVEGIKRATGPANIDRGSGKTPNPF
jgi:hypothetical protein